MKNEIIGIFAFIILMIGVLDSNIQIIVMVLIVLQMIGKVK